MKLSISNIAWKADQDEAMYEYLCRSGIQGLEIAPTRIFPEEPYEHPVAAAAFAERLRVRYGLEISSMQSIWFGRKEMMFAGKTERMLLADYTRRAILFAEAVSCKNLVFGCPRNRKLPPAESTQEREAVRRESWKTACEFFHDLGEFAVKHSTVLAMEANPPVYQTDFINRTEEALQLIREVDSAGFQLNVDLGTVIENRESLSLLKGRTSLISHVHISEPGIWGIKARGEHGELAEILRNADYRKYVSIEMKVQDDREKVYDAIAYVKEVFQS